MREKRVSASARRAPLIIWRRGVGTAGHVRELRPMHGRSRIRNLRGGQIAARDDSCTYMPSQDVTTVRPERPVTAEQRTRVRPIAVTKPQAAAALSMSVDSFERYVQPDLRVIRRGRLRLFTVAELERWANENAQRTLP